MVGIMLLYYVYCAVSGIVAGVFLSDKGTVLALFGILLLSLFNGLVGTILAGHLLS